MKNSINGMKVPAAFLLYAENFYKYTTGGVEAVNPEWVKNLYEAWLIDGDWLVALG